MCCESYFIFFFSSRRRHTRYIGDWSSDVCSSDLKWDKQGVRLERIDWTRGEGGRLTSHRALPDGLEFFVRVEPAADGVRMELRLKNGTDRKLSGLSADRKSTRLNSSHRCISYAVF